MHGWIILECINFNAIAQDMQEVRIYCKLLTRSMLVHYIPFIQNTLKYTKELLKILLKLLKEDHTHYDKLEAISRPLSSYPVLYTPTVEIPRQHTQLYNWI